MKKERRFNESTLRKRAHSKFNVPVIGHFFNKSVKYNSILEAEELTGIQYHMIFDACIGRTRTAYMAYWEYENGKHWIKYHAKQVMGKRNLMRLVGFNG